MTLPAIFSLSGDALTADEKALFEEVKPAGYILFKRNIKDHAQIRNLTDDLRACANDENIPILIDQEGGRVQRLPCPPWTTRKAMQDCTDPDLLEREIRAIADDLNEAGVNVNCAPLLDVVHANTSESIGDRAFSNDPAMVANLGAIVCETYLKNGITPVIKHLPGHGRAQVDSHQSMPFIDAPMDKLRAVDFMPFQSMTQYPHSVKIWGMVGHCCYTEIDPDLPASLSPAVIRDIIRREIGFTGVLCSDDLSMGALNDFGTVAERAKKSVEAGCDLALYCAGDLQEMKDIADILS